ncbi:hypothetical protein BHE74_00006906 [Ensete ventricosum]|nr:hypothetical protein BHE74_00006906 [Ensete ventricosum]
MLTNTASTRLTYEIGIELQEFEDPPPLRMQQYVIGECRRWNLIWVGRHSVDTVTYHLLILKGMFSDGMTVLSLFSRIGGAEVALHRLGIRLKMVVSLEISEPNRKILKCWWDQTNQTGALLQPDVRQFDRQGLEQLITELGGFDLVIGLSPCNNLAGSNRHRREVLQGNHYSRFHDYLRILQLVTCVMGKKS